MMSTLLVVSHLLFTVPRDDDDDDDSYFIEKESEAQRGYPAVTWLRIQSQISLD